MTTKPRAKKFRIRRAPAAASASATAAPAASAPEPLAASPERVQPKPSLPPEQAIPADNQVEDGFGNETFPTAAKAQPSAGGNGPGAAEELAAIKREGLTGRQLRMARRIAQRNGLSPSSDYDAVLLLRRQGIDPFKSANMLELVVAEQPGGGAKNLPQTVKAAPPPSTEVDEATRAAEIIRIQRDIARRRQRSTFMLFARLAFFVGLPTFIAGYYYAYVATPLYASYSQFVIQQNEGGGGASMGGLFSGTSFATSQDSISVQSYLQSRDAMLRLDRDLGFKAHFQDENVDAIQRLGAEDSNEAAYKIYQKNVKISYDPTEGVVKMEVIATDPAEAVAFSSALISYAEEQVDQLTKRLREDQMSGARESYADAESKMLAAQRRVVELQEARGVLSAEAESSLVMGQISTFETELQKERLRLQEMQSNARPNRTKVEVAERNIERLGNLIAELRSELTESENGSSSLARITGELLVAQADLETRQILLQQALQQVETARIEANKQTRFLALPVKPVQADEATYPRVFENTMLALLIFSGIYLMASLTAAILKEQVSS